VAVMALLPATVFAERQADAALPSVVFRVGSTSTAVICFLCMEK